MKLDKTLKSLEARSMEIQKNSQSLLKNTRNVEAQKEVEILVCLEEDKCKNHSKMYLLHSKLVKSVSQSKQTVEFISYFVSNDYLQCLNLAHLFHLLSLYRKILKYLMHVNQMKYNLLVSHSSVTLNYFIF